MGHKISLKLKATLHDPWRARSSSLDLNFKGNSISMNFLKKIISKKRKWVIYKNMILKTVANCDKPIRMCQSRSWAVTIFVAISFTVSYFAYFVNSSLVPSNFSHRYLRFCWLYLSYSGHINLWIIFFANMIIKQIATISKWLEKMS